MADNNEIKVKSLQKALEILNLFTVKPVLGVTEVSEYFGWYKSTVHNILCTLKSMEYLEQDEETGKYRLGIQVFNLSKALGDNYSITKLPDLTCRSYQILPEKEFIWRFHIERKYCIWMQCIQQNLLS